MYANYMKAIYFKDSLMYSLPLKKEKIFGDIAISNNIWLITRSMLKGVTAC